MMGLRGKDSFSAGISRRFIYLLLILILGEACHRSGKDNFSPTGESLGKIVYDTYIINRDSTDFWGNECLSAFNRSGFIDKIFADVYAGKIIPYDYFSGARITLNQLKMGENVGDFSRKNISKIQFEENWLWDREKIEMHKEVISMTIAYEVYDNAGRSRGQKPVFKLVFRK